MVSYKKKILSYSVLYSTFSSSTPTAMCDLIVPASTNASAFLIPLVCKLFLRRAEVVFVHKAMLRPVMLNLMCRLV